MTYLEFINLLHPNRMLADPCKYDHQLKFMTSPSALENYFASFRKNIIGNQQTFESPFGKKEIIYADWTASGRAYKPIEDCIQKEIMPFVANTHTETNITSTLISRAYEEAKIIIKKHVGANSNDVLIFCGSGMTSAVNKLQRILGLRIPERMMDYMKKESMQLDEALRPIVLSHTWNTTAIKFPGLKQLQPLK